ncbi:MAG: class IIb bacteriocin, lactobin A/cerein 7B family [Bacillales bacterium]|nr:class IIb bacteriocin, lactobin A/cerein 7B family [Bacillales bacterium]
MRVLNDEELDSISGGAVTLAAVMAVLAASIVAVIVYKLFTSEKGSTTLPGGWKFTWN